MHALKVLRKGCIALGASLVSGCPGGPRIDTPSPPESAGGAAPGAVEREQQFLHARATVAAVRRAGTTLELLGTDGPLALQAVREGDD